MILQEKSKDNLILAADAYKIPHWLLVPKKTTNIYSYLESRGGKFPATIFFGLQIYLKKYLEGRIIQKWMIDEAEEFCKMMFGQDYFNRKGWEKIVYQHDGVLPIRIKAVPEGTLVPTGNVLMTVENTDAELPWLTNYVETLLFEAMWYGTTVATNSFYTRKLIDHFAKMCGEKVGPFHLNDFGFRGVSSKESAGIGGAAHLVNFLGTDTLEGIRYAMKYYNADVCGYSVMASEHSVTTLYQKEHELSAYTRFLEVCPDDALLSIVLDSYDYQKAVVDYICGSLFLKIKNRKGKVVLRPDSGYPPAISKWTLQTLWEYYGGTTNERGYKVLDPHVGIIYGDGIDYEMIDEILQTITSAGFAPSNIVFGEGGGLLQKVDRDQQRMAFKASWGRVDGQDVEVFKETKTDVSKASKRGKLKLVKDVNQTFKTVKLHEIGDDELRTVFVDGKLMNTSTFAEVRERANSYL